MGWSAREDRALLEAVQQYGRRWSRILSAVDSLSGRTSEGLRRRWSRLSHVSDSVPVSAQPVIAITPDIVPSLPPPRRDRTGGRPWAYFVDASSLSSRSPSPRQRVLLHNWGLMLTPDTKLLCNLQRAESIVRRHLSSSHGATNRVALCLASS